MPDFISTFLVVLFAAKVARNAFTSPLTPLDAR